MRKVLVLFGILAVTQMASFAYMKEGTTSDIEVLRAAGYSESALKFVDTVNYINKGEDVNRKYVKYFTPKRTNKLGRAYTALKLYVDPKQDDNRFGEHQIEFTNTWNGDMPHYSTGTKAAREKIENL